MILFSPLILAALFLLGVVVGGLSNVTSGGAGIFTIYFLTVFAGLTIQESTGTVLAASTVIVLIGGIAFLRRGQVNKQLALTVGVSGVLAAFLAARWAASINSVLLEEVFGAFTLALAIYSGSGLALERLRRRRNTGPDPVASETSAPAVLPPTDALGASQTPPSRYMGTDPASLAVQLTKGVFIGLATGLFGVGLASLSVILFILLFRLDLKVVLGTSLLASFMRYLGGSIGYLTTGLISPVGFVVLVVGGAVGSLAGAKVILQSRPGSLDLYVKLLVIAILVFVSYEFLLSRLGA